MSTINTNISALRAQAALTSNEVALSTAMERLSTGNRINTASDDAAGLAITTRMTADIRGLNIAVRNANDGISMAQTAEGALGTITDMLQRMRELAVQAATGTYGDSERANLNQEVLQLKAEMENIANTTSFNGRQLLDGSGVTVKIQSNVSAGDQITMSFVNVKPSHLGTGAASSLTALGRQGLSELRSPSSPTAADVKDQLSEPVAGDLVLNGVTISSPVSGSDTASFANEASSAIAMTAAINLATAESGVKAIVGKTVASGTAMSSGVISEATGTAVINGIETSSISFGPDRGVNRANAITAINAISDQTGVRAEEGGSDTLGVRLIADDGRNITIQLKNPLSGINSGLPDPFTDDAGANSGSLSKAVTFTGTYSLVSVGGAPIKVTAATTGDISRAGVVAGSYASGVGTIGSAPRAVASAPLELGATAGQFGPGSMKINGIDIPGGVDSSDTASAVDSVNMPGSEKTSSAISIAAAINSVSDSTGVTAKIGETTIFGESWATPATDLTGTIVVNGIEIDMTLTQGTTRQTLAGYFNAKSVQTGVVAQDNGRGLTFSAADGRNVTIYSQQTGMNESEAGLASDAAPTFTKSTTVDPTTNKLDSTYEFRSMVSGESVTINGITVAATGALTAAEVAGAFDINAATSDDVSAYISGKNVTITGQYTDPNFPAGGSSGVTVDGDSVTFRSSERFISDKNLGIDGSSYSNAQTDTEKAVTKYGSVILESQDAFYLDASANGAKNLKLLGFEEGWFGGTSTGMKITGIDISTQAGAYAAMDVIDAAMDQVTASAANLGAAGARLIYTIDNLTNMSTNMQASRSRIMDTDYAVETTALARAQIIQQAATAMLAQANQSSQSVLTLLK